MVFTPATNEEQWDAFTLAHGGGFLQSWGWSQFQESLGREVLRLCIDASGPGGQDDTVVQCTLIYHPLPFGRKYAYVPRGPIVKLSGTDQESNIREFEIATNALRIKTMNDAAIFTRVEWPFALDATPISPLDIRSWGFRDARSMQPSDTVIMDLTMSEEALLSGMHQKTRYNIRVAERHGVVVREALMDDAHFQQHDLDLFWFMLNETAVRDKFHTHEKEYYNKMLEFLCAKNNVGALQLRLFFAEYGGQAIAAAIVVEYGDTVTYLHGASIASQRGVMAPHLLHWTIIRNAKRAGFHKYDFWGVASTDDPEDPWAGITRFKVGFGGKRVRYLGAWELPASRFWYSLYRYAKRFRNL